MKLEEVIKVGMIHEKRMRFAIDALSPLFPLSTKDLESISDEHMLLLELFTSRFSKLQDLMGHQLFTLFLQELGEWDASMTLIDKLNKLEKFKVIPSASEWRTMREIRNHLSHEYPEHPEIMASYLNTAFKMGQKLLEVFDVIKTWPKE